jgi:hypothetical protein
MQDVVGPVNVSQRNLRFNGRKIEEFIYLSLMPQLETYPIGPTSCLLSARC